MLFSLLFLSFLLIGKGENIRDQVLGTWIVENKIHNDRLNDTSEHYKPQYPYIFDFKQNGEFVFKNYAYKDTVYTWFLKSDSVLTVNNLDYIIHSINQDSIIIIDYNGMDIYWHILKRPRNIKIDYTIDEIRNILLSNIWTIADSLDRSWETHFEYCNNGTVIYRIRGFNRSFNDTIENLQLETWGVDQYISVMSMPLSQTGRPNRKSARDTSLTRRLHSPITITILSDIPYLSARGTQLITGTDLTDRRKITRFMNREQVITSALGCMMHDWPGFGVWIP